MSEDTDTIAEFITNVGTLSYFDDYRDLAQRTSELGALRASLDPVQALSRGNINRNSEDEVAALDGALTLLAQYQAESDAAAREALAAQAIADSDAALTSLTDLIAAQKDATSPNSQSYAFGVLHYAILVRQTVADTVQDGPYGAPGLLPSVTTAARLLFDDGTGTDLFSTLFTTIAEEIEVVNLQGTSADAAVSFDIVSAFGDITIPVEIFREDGETDADFQARIEAVTSEQANVLFEAEQDNIDVDAFQAIGTAVTEFLADTPAAAPEVIGGDGADTGEGTALADYFSGLGGDDVFNGAAGPDALNGGDGNDILRGGAFQDVLVGGAGNDLLFGGNTRDDTANGDVARFDGLAAEHTILGGTDYAVIIGPDGSRDKAFDVSFLRFDDGDITLQTGSALDTGEVPFETLNKNNFDIGERVALLYEAALNRNGEIDLPGLNFYVDVTARDNLSDEFLAADLMTSQEFTDNFGDANTLSNQAFLEQIYLNVLDRPSDADGLAFYLGLLNDGTISKAAALADIAVSPENTDGSAEILQSLYETTAPEVDDATGIALDWSFIA